MKEEIINHIIQKYSIEPEYLWKRYPGYAIFRHSDNRKWFAGIMNTTKDKLGENNHDEIYVVNVKVDDLMLRDILLHEDGYYPAYHMAKGSWLSISLDGTVPFEDICKMIDESFRITASSKKKKRYRQPKEWIVPANPKYYDIVNAFNDNTVIDWKQGAGIVKGDTVYMYVGAPFSAILFKCLVTETDIPYDYENKNLKITAVMKIELKKRYDPQKFTFSTLKAEYGIYAVRGPRGVPYNLSLELK